MDKSDNAFDRKRAGSMHIVLDRPTVQFLFSLKDNARRYGISLKNLSLALGHKPKWLYKIVGGWHIPSLGDMYALVKFFGYDWSESVNMRFWKNPGGFVRKLERRLEKHGVKAEDIVRETSFGISAARNAAAGDISSLRMMYELEQMLDRMDQRKKVIQ